MVMTDDHPRPPFPPTIEPISNHKAWHDYISLSTGLPPYQGDIEINASTLDSSNINRTMKWDAEYSIKIGALSHTNQVEYPIQDQWNIPLFYLFHAI
jgi:hypothetical protein